MIFGMVCVFVKEQINGCCYGCVCISIEINTDYLLWAVFL
jgi:hypothetical protein